MQKPVPIGVIYYISRLPLIEGPVDLNEGAWPISWYRIAKGWGILPRAFWPDEMDVEGKFLTTEPPNLDEVAKRDRITWYQRLRTETECLYAVFNTQLPSSVSLEITSAWGRKSNGWIPPHDQTLPIKCVHSIPLFDFDFDTNHFVFANSWGEKWGDRGFGYLPLGYLSQNMTEGWMCDAHTRQAPPIQPGVQFAPSKGQETKLGLPLILDIRDGDNNVVVGWAHIVRRESSLDVEELFVRPDFRRKGYGTELVVQIKRLAKTGVPLRFWVPWGDHCEHNAASILAWARKAGLRLELSKVRWSAYLATDGEPVDSLPVLPWIPRKTTGPLVSLDDPEVESNIQPEHGWNDYKASRRAELVEKDYRSSLTADESDELELLQEEFGRYQDIIAPLPMD